MSNTHKNKTKSASPVGPRPDAPPPTSFHDVAQGRTRTEARPSTPPPHPSHATQNCRKLCRFAKSNTESAASRVFNRQQFFTSRWPAQLAYNVLSHAGIKQKQSLGRPTFLNGLSGVCVCACGESPKCAGCRVVWSRLLVSSQVLC